MEHQFIVVIVILLILIIIIWWFTSQNTLISRCEIKSRQLSPPNNSFNVNAYLGKWYEIAKIPVGFQFDSNGKPLTNVTANYSLNNNVLNIVNCGISSSTNKEICANATGNLSAKPGVFNVSFFPGISAPYIILGLSDIKDGQYQTAVVGSENKDMLWLLSRQPTSGASDVNEQIQLLKDIGTANGYSIDMLSKIVATQHLPNG
jgi:apolipoprotein D and lipocalin family protein